MLDVDSTAIVPVLIGEYSEVAGLGRVYKRFDAFGGLDGEPWPDAYSTTCRSRTIKETMNKLFEVQGIHVDPRNLDAALNRVCQALVA